MNINRRKLLMLGSSLVAANMIGFPVPSLAEELNELDVASAGSIRATLEGPIKTSIAKDLTLDLHTHSEGADAVAQALIRGQLSADVFIPITASPMRTVMLANKAEIAFPIARTELVLVYSPKSRFAPQFERAAKREANWWEVLQEPGIRIGRGNPTADPGARAILFALMLAAQKYNQPSLVEKVLGPTLNPEQIVPGVQAGLQSGAIDLSSSYKISAISGGLPYIELPTDINLSSLEVHVQNPEMRLAISEKIFYPEPLVFYAAALKGAPHQASAAAFVEWLKRAEAEALFQQHQFAPVGEAQPLHA